MRSKYFLGLLVAGVATAALVGGCGSDPDPDPTGGGGNDASASNSSSSSSSSASSTGTGGTGGGPSVCGDDADKNCDFDTAEDITISDDPDADKIAADLEPVDEDSDFYKFEGKKGQAILIYTEAKVGNDPFDPAYADLVITLFDAGKKQVAKNDDPTPRNSNDSEIFTVLPSDGTYYLRVEECNVAFPMGCGSADDINDSSYNVAIFNLDPALTSVTQETAPDNSEAAPDSVEYQKAQSGGYIISTVDGFYKDASDRDFYKFKLPADVAVTAGSRLNGSFQFLPTGVDGNGSTAPNGVMAIVDPVQYMTDKSKRIAEIDGSKFDSSGGAPDLVVPLAKDKEYWVIVDAPKTGGDFGGNPFYFFFHNGGGGNPIEKEAVAAQNDTTVTAEALTKSMGQDSYFIEGDISSAGADVDIFSTAVPTAATLMNAVCGAQRSGSGLRGVKMSLIGQDGTTVLKTGTESADADLLIEDVAVKEGEKIFVKIEATSQDPNVTSTFYRCGIHYRAM